MNDNRLVLSQHSHWRVVGHTQDEVASRSEPWEFGTLSWGQMGITGDFELKNKMEFVSKTRKRFTSLLDSKWKDRDIIPVTEY